MSASSKPLKILQIVDRDSSGGIPKIIDLIHRSGERNGWDVRTEAWFGDTPQHWKSAKISVVDSLIGKMLALRKLLQAFKPDILHDHYGGLNSVSYLVGTGRLKTVFHLHNELIVHEDSPDDRRTFRTELFRKRLLPRYNQFIAVSDHSKKQLLSVCPSASGRLSVLHNAIAPLLGETMSKQDARAALGWNPKGFYILGLGRIVFEKGFEHHIRVLKLLVEKIPSAMLVLVGDGDARCIESLKKEASELGILDHVQFVGRAENPAKFYRAADFFLFSSHQEPFGLTLIEAMRCQCPVISVFPEKGGGPKEFIRHAQNAWVTSRNPVETADAIQRLYLDGTFRKILLQGATETAALFSEEQYGQKLKERYDDLLS